MWRVYWAAWKWLTRRTMRANVAYLAMKHHLETEWNACCADPRLRERLGIELFANSEES